MGKKSRNNLTRYIFIIFLVISLFLNSLWIILNSYPPRADGIRFIREAIEISNSGNKYLRTLIFSPYPDTPLLPTLLTYQYYKIFGLYTGNELIVNSLSLLIILFFTYKIGSIIYNKKVGLLSSVILNSFFAITYMSKMAYLEFHLLALTSLGLYLLLKTNYFKNTVYSALFGITLGLAALTKYTFFIYMFPPLVYYVIILLRKVKFFEHPLTSVKNNLKIYYNGVLSFIFFILIGGFWYLNSMKFSVVNSWWGQRLQDYALESELQNFKLLSFQNIFYDLKNLVSNIGWFFLILFLLALFWKIIGNRKKEEEDVLIVGFIVPYIILIFSPVKFLLQMIPAYFVIAIFIAYFINNVKKTSHKLNTLLISLIVVMGVVYPLTPFFSNSPIQNNLFYISMDSTAFSKNESSIYKPFEYIKNNEEGHKNILLLSNSGDEFWDLIYYRDIYNQEFSIYSVFKPVHYYVFFWYKPTTAISNKDGLLDERNTNLTYLINNINFNHVLTFMPKNTSSVENSIPATQFNKLNNTNFILEKEFYYKQKIIRLYTNRR